MRDLLPKEVEEEPAVENPLDIYSSYIFADSSSSKSLENNATAEIMNACLLAFIISAVTPLHICGVGIAYNQQQSKSENLIAGNFKIESPAGAPIADMKLTLLSPQSPANKGGKKALSDSVYTDQEGKAKIFVEMNAPFVVQGTKPPDFQDMYIYGTSGGVEFNYTTYMGTRAEAQALAALSEMVPPYDASTGYLIVGMDTLRDPDAGLDPSNLIPAAGASALIYNVPTPYAGFIFDPAITASQTITNRSSSFVTYPNVGANVLGQAVAFNAEEVDKNTCTISPGFTSQIPPQVIEAFPDSVTVVSFLC